jgi:hypothetical protein
VAFAKLSPSRIGSKDSHKCSYPPSSALAWLSTSSLLARRPVRPRDTDLPFVRTSLMAMRVSHVGGPLGALPGYQIDVQLVSNNNRDESRKRENWLTLRRYRVRPGPEQCYWCYCYSSLPRLDCQTGSSPRIHLVELQTPKLSMTTTDTVFSHKFPLKTEMRRISRTHCRMA